ncbi:MAG: hypothetical protein ACPGVO_00545 [Spirulinaceae cyanobacterium]
MKQYGISGKRSHDIRLVAVMLAAGVERVLTLNPQDFRGLPEIEAVHPLEVQP